MSLSIYDVCIPTFTRALGNLAAVLEKGRAHAEAEKIEPSALLGMRLYPDMLPLTYQVRIASDNAKGCVARLAQIEPPKFADDESSFAELHQRLEKTIDFVKGIQPRQLEGSESRPIELKFPQRTLSFKTGLDYFTSFALPNVYFHCTTAYDILRHGGVKIGKSDFIGPVA
ncbi:MAG TPA: DUF1993 domain-containing protein [Steroidobacteraceae bacterium]|jgi:hypothetical protein|nr:DUF1993 domain-containing protein [Steroidobacteraceae bacterium]